MATEAEICAAIAASGVFDSDWYLAQNPDVAATGMDPVLHYVRFGEAENRAPARDFNLARHRMLYPGSSHVLYDFIRTPTGRAAQRSIPIAFACNEHYAPYLGVAITSLLINADPSWNYDIYLLYRDMRVETLARLRGLAHRNVDIHPMRVDSFVSEITSNREVSGYVTHEGYFAALIPRLLAEHDVCIYLDCDVVVNDSLVELIGMNLSCSAVAAVRDNWLEPEHLMRIGLETGRNPDRYFNPGVMVFNNEVCVANELHAKFMELVSSGSQFENPRQTIFNLACEDRVMLLPQRWNCMWRYFVQDGFHFSDHATFLGFKDCAKNPAIVHFNSDLKPWRYDDGWFAGHFWRYAKMSPFFSQLRRECPYSIWEIESVCGALRYE